MTEQDVFSETRMPPDGNIKVRRWKVTVEVNNFGTDGEVLSQKKEHVKLWKPYVLRFKSYKQG